MIRQAVPQDAEAVAGLLRALNDEPGLAPERITPAGVARDLIDDPRAVVLVALRGDAVAGVATAHAAYDSGQSRWGLFLNDLYVAPDARRHGLGRALVAGMAAEARRQGSDHLWWNADEGDTLALSFHRSFGLEEAVVTDFLLAGDAFDRLVAEAQA